MTAVDIDSISRERIVSTNSVDETETLRRLGHALNRARQARPATMAEVSDAVDITLEALANIEAGRSRPRLKTLVNLLVWLELPPRRLQAEIAQADPDTAELLKGATEFYAVYQAISGSR
jgi:transcriptional regulator with XRE-family HTH domain